MYQGDRGSRKSWKSWKNNLVLEIKEKSWNLFISFWNMNRFMSSTGIYIVFEDSSAKRKAF